MAGDLADSLIPERNMNWLTNIMLLSDLYNGEISVYVVDSGLAILSQDGTTFG